MLLTRWPRVSDDDGPAEAETAALNGICSTTRPDESRASMKKRCVAWSNCRLTGKDGSGAVVAARAATGGAGLRSASGCTGGAGAGDASRLSGVATGAAARIDESPVMGRPFISAKTMLRYQRPPLRDGHRTLLTGSKNCASQWARHRVACDGIHPGSGTICPRQPVALAGRGRSRPASGLRHRTLCQ